MELNLLMIQNRLHLSPTAHNREGQEAELSLRYFRMYRGEALLRPHTLYLADAMELVPNLSGPKESGLIIIGSSDSDFQKPDCPWLLLPNTVDKMELINSLNTIFLRFQRLDYQLQTAIYEGDSFQRMVDLFIDIPQNEIILMNSDFDIIACSNEDVKLYSMSGLNWDKNLRRLPPENLEFFKNDINYAKVRDLREPFLYTASIYAVDVICMNVFLHDDFICRVVFCETDSPFQPYDYNLLRYFTSWIQAKYDLLKSDDPYQKTSRLDALFTDLLDQKQVDIPVLRKQMNARGWLNTHPLLCITLHPSDRDYYNATLQYYCQLITERYEKVICLIYQGNIVCVVNLNAYDGTSGSFRRRFAPFLRDSYFKAGYSTEFKDITRLYYYYKQASIALSTGMDIEPFAWQYTFKDYCLSYMQQKITSDIPAAYLIHTGLLNLQAHDRVHGTEYMKTLLTYLDYRLNAAASAEALYIHRTTMMYRLSKIKEFTRINFSDSKEVLYLQISAALLQEEKN